MTAVGGLQDVRAALLEIEQKLGLLDREIAGVRYWPLVRSTAGELLYRRVALNSVATAESLPSLPKRAISESRVLARHLGMHAVGDTKRVVRALASLPGRTPAAGAAGESCAR